MANMLDTNDLLITVLIAGVMVVLLVPLSILAIIIVFLRARAKSKKE